MVRKDPDRVGLRFCLVFPDTYAVGMSFDGLHILYGVLNARDDVYAERAFSPWTDMQRQLRHKHIPLCSLETFTPLRDFDAVGISLQYEMTYTNVLDILELGGIPILASDRTPDDPIVVAGGPCALNPEPMADFIDLFVLGESEERISDLATACIELKHAAFKTREEQCIHLVERVANTYAPSLYDAAWRPNGQLKHIRPREALQDRVPARVEREAVADFENAFVPTRPIVPFVEIIHDRIAIEIMRGCSRGCRFCHAGMTRRPVRCRSVEKIIELAEAQHAATGYSEISLTSLSAGDHPDLPRLLKALATRFADRKVSINLPSLRINDQLHNLPGMLSGVRKATLTIAPEAATDRLRRVINKDIEEEDLFRGVEAAYAQGRQHVKLYFMIGLPTETDEDILAIPKLVERVSRLRKKNGKGPGRVNVSVAAFVPKPHTPFQREPMAPLQRLREIGVMLRQNTRSRAISLKPHRPERSFLEGVFARGDRRLGKLILEAHRLGCRFDAWDETFDYAAWLRAFDQSGVNGEFYANRRRESDECLPWAHLNAGVSEEFLARELARAMRGELTPDCRTGRCHNCGVLCGSDKPEPLQPTLLELCDKRR